MDVSSIIHTVVRLFILLVLPLGIWTSLVGIWLNKRYSGDKRENMIVTGGMLVTSMFLTALFLLAIYTLPTIALIAVICTYVISIPTAIFMYVRHRRRIKKELIDLLKG